MSNTKPENRFISSIHKYFLARGPYYEKMFNPLRGGTPDVYYSGEAGDLWVEYKFTKITPRTKRILPGLTALQKRWLDCRYDEGRNVAVILGTPEGGVVYQHKQWGQPLTGPELLERLLTRQELAQWIISQTGVSSWQSQKLS